MFRASHNASMIISFVYAIKKYLACSIPSSRCLNSGQIIALPAYAPSTCSHSCSLWQMRPSSSTLSNAQEAVVPRVAPTNMGMRPTSLSRSIAFCRWQQVPHWLITSKIYLYKVITQQPQSIFWATVSQKNPKLRSIAAILKSAWNN